MPTGHMTGGNARICLLTEPLGTLSQLRELNGRKSDGATLTEMSRSTSRSSYGLRLATTESGHTVPNRWLTSPRCCSLMPSPQPTLSVTKAC